MVLLLLMLTIYPSFYVDKPTHVQSFKAVWTFLGSYFEVVFLNLKECPPEHLFDSVLPYKRHLFLAVELNGKLNYNKFGLNNQGFFQRIFVLILYVLFKVSFVLKEIPSYLLTQNLT